MNKIPKIIHQTWREAKLPLPFNILAETWKNTHPDWEYKLWTDGMIKEFIKDFYPKFLDKYNSYPRKIQQVDVFRYLLLLKEGGVYIDVDFECIENITILLEKESCVIGKEPEAHCAHFAMKMILGNAFMACSAGNDFMKFVCNEIMLYPGKDKVSQIEVLKSTGPFMLTSAFEKYRDKQNVKILEPEKIYPLNMYETRKVFNDAITDDMQHRINNAYAVHYFWGGW